MQRSISSLGSNWTEGTLILMYHAIEAMEPGQPWSGLYVEPRKLHAQIAELQATGARFIRADDLLKPESRDRQVLITLDDGFQNVFADALPIFRELGVPALAYIVAGELGGSNTWDHAKGFPKRPLMSRTEIREWVASGCEIGAHTMTHPNLAEIPVAEARHEIFESKKVLEDVTGQPVRHFCYPYGGCNEAVRALVEEAGFETATSVKGGYNFPETDRFLLRRVTARE